MSNDKVKRWIRPDILKARAYHVQNAEGFIKLDAMENPYQWPDDIKQSWLQLLETVEINRYPAADAKELKEKLKRVFLIPDDNEILLGNGSDELIQVIALSLSERDPVFLAPEPGFVMYKVIAEAARVGYVGVPLKQDFSLDLEAMLIAIEKYEPAVIFLACPNNPTANQFDERDILELVKNAPGIVVIDEAYYAFSGTNYMSMLADFDNLIIMRTLSKIGLAGLRLGFLAGPSCWIEQFNKMRLPYNINVLTQKSIEFILDHTDILNEQAGLICRDREVVFSEMQKMSGINVWPSKTNFLIFRVENGKSNYVFEQLKGSGVLIKNLGNSHPLVRDCLRVTVGSGIENEKFLGSLHDILSGTGAS